MKPLASIPLEPFLRYSLGFLWVVSGVTGLLDMRGWAVLLVKELPIGMGLALVLLSAACLADLVVAVLVVRRWRPRLLARVQFALVLFYTAIATMLFPSLWMEPLGPLLKNIPILGAILAWDSLVEKA